MPRPTSLQCRPRACPQVVLLGLGAIVSLALIGVWCRLAGRPEPLQKSNIETAVRDATGRDFALVATSISDFSRGWRCAPARVSSAMHPASAPNPGSWKRAQLGAKLLPLLRGRMVADRVILEGADLRLVRRADGTANWQGIGSQIPRQPGHQHRAHGAAHRWHHHRTRGSRSWMKPAAARRDHRLQSNYRRNSAR